MDQNLETAVLRHARSWRTAREIAGELKLSNYYRRVVLTLLRSLEGRKKVEGRMRQNGRRGHPAREFKRR